jgi:hypothetical protein
MADFDDVKRTARREVKRADKARNFPQNTCSASRHVFMMAEALSKGQKYHMLDEEPEHCAASLASVVSSLWELRTATGLHAPGTPITTPAARRNDAPADV